MKIKLKNGKKVHEQAIQRLEAELGFSLSESFKSFARENDGAVPEDNLFKVNERIESGVRRFIPIDKIPGERRAIENLPPMSYPVAWDECGNYIFIDERKNGCVYFWDHELPDQITKVADNFEAFLSILAPFDVDAVRLKPGQVESVWIDPEFLKKLKENGEIDA